MAGLWGQDRRPAGGPWTREPSTSTTVPPRRDDPYSAAVWTLDDDDPLPSTAPRAPHLERVLAWLAPRWAMRRATARAALQQHAIMQRVTAVADERQRARNAASSTNWLRPPRVREVGGFRIPR